MAFLAFGAFKREAAAVLVAILGSCECLSGRQPLAFPAVLWQQVLQACHLWKASFRGVIYAQELILS